MSTTLPVEITGGIYRDTPDAGDASVTVAATGDGLIAVSVLDVKLDERETVWLKPPAAVHLASEILAAALREEHSA